MTGTQGVLLGFAAAAGCFGAFLLGRHSSPPVTPTPVAVAPAIASPAPNSAPLPPVIMYPPSSRQPVTGLSGVPTAAPLPINASDQAIQDAKDTQLARDKERLAEIAQSSENANRQSASEGKAPMPDATPGFHIDTSGNVYHLENGRWRLMSNKELENPTPQEQAQADAGLAAAKASQGQRQ